MVWALFTFVIPADANSVITSEAIAELRYLAFEARWEDGLAVIEEAKALLTEPDADLLIWEAVVRDKLGQAGKAREALALDALDPQGYFLLGNVAEVEGDAAAAIELFEQTCQLAIESGVDELAASPAYAWGRYCSGPRTCRYSARVNRTLTRAASKLACVWVVFL